MDKKNDKYIYEVIRIIEGKPLFLEEHYERLAASLEMAGFPGAISEEKFASAMGDFIQNKSIVNDNVKFIAHVDTGTVETEFEYIKGHYPTDEQYANGVDTQLLQAMRDNPHAKVHNQELRQLANDIIAQNNLWEVILVDDDGFITEGSRSNIFFIRDGKVYTSPSEGVLLGVTRQRIIAACKDGGLDVIEEPIKATELDKYDAAFISGTSPKVLPIAKIDNLVLDVNEKTLREVIRLFNEAIDTYLNGI